MCDLAPLNVGEALLDANPATIPKRACLNRRLDVIFDPVNHLLHRRLNRMKILVLKSLLNVPQFQVRRFANRKLDAASRPVVPRK